MAADFMEHPVRLPSRTLWFTSLFLLSCTHVGKQLQATFILADTVTVDTRQGITYIDQQPANGILFALYPNKKDSLYVKPFIKGKPDGLTKSWYPDGRLNEVRNYKKGWEQGEARGYWPNGKERFVYHFVNDVYDGNLEEWTTAGILAKNMNYSKGQEDGTQKIWYDNGVLRSNYLIKNGRRYGLIGTKTCINVVDSLAALR